MRPTHTALLALAFQLLGCSSGGDDTGTSPEPTTPPTTIPVANVSALFVLGDSLSDVGNAAGLVDYLLNQPIAPATVGLCNPADVFVFPRPCGDLFYRQSRVSNGPVAVEHLAAHLRLDELAPSFHIIPNRPSAGSNYAVASAKARGPEVEDLGRQVDILLLNHASLPADALYVVMIGGNDAIDAFQAVVVDGPTAAATSAAIVTSAVAAIGANVERLLVFGARWIVVANVPDLATLPAVLAAANATSDPAALLAAASSIADAFDRELSVLLEQLASRTEWSSPTPHVLVRFDLRAVLRAAQQDAAANGRNSLDACFDSDVYRQSTAERVFHPACSPAAGSPPRFAEFVFWDGIHPTGAAHAAIGAALIAQVDAELAN